MFALQGHWAQEPRGCCGSVVKSAKPTEQREVEITETSASDLRKGNRNNANAPFPSEGLALGTADGYVEVWLANGRVKVGKTGIP